MYCSECNFKKWQFLIKLKESQQCWGFFLQQSIRAKKNLLLNILSLNSKICFEKKM